VDVRESLELMKRSKMGPNGLGRTRGARSRNMEGGTCSSTVFGAEFKVFPLMKVQTLKLRLVGIRERRIYGPFEKTNEVSHMYRYRFG